RHRTSPGNTPGWPQGTRPSATSARYTTRAAITEVLPDPAPATTTHGSSGAEIAAHCSDVGLAPPSAIRISDGTSTTSGRDEDALITSPGSVEAVVRSGTAVVPPGTADRWS